MREAVCENVLYWIISLAWSPAFTLAMMNPGGFHPGHGLEAKICTERPGCERGVGSRKPSTSKWSVVQGACQDR